MDHDSVETMVELASGDFWRKCRGTFLCIFVTISIVLIVKYFSMSFPLQHRVPENQPFQSES